MPVPIFVPSPKMKVGLTGINKTDGRRVSITLADYAKGDHAVHKKVAEVRGSLILFILHIENAL